MQNRFDGKVIAIAGGAGGIGSVVSKRLAGEGAAVMVGDLNIEDAENVVADIRRNGGEATSFKLDIGDEANIVAFIEAAVGKYGGIDGFHANASDTRRVVEDDDLTTMDLGAYDQHMDANTRGFFLCTRHAVPQLLKRGGGSMLYTSSGAVYMGDRTRPVYAMGKSAVHALCRHVASRWGKQGIRANVVSPGLVVHPAVLKAMGQEFVDGALKTVKTPRLGDPSDIAAMAALLLSDEAGYITAQIICVDGGSTMRP